VPAGGGDGGGDDGGIGSGTLACGGCPARYPVHDGVPRLLMDDGLVRRTREGFEYQWTQRQQGRAERRRVVYGYEIEPFMDWVAGTFTAGLRSAPGGGAWLLDAGCGSAEKARALAQRFPEHQVVAMDQSGSVAVSARENADVPNLHFVQANVWFPPFAQATFRFVMSIGVLHHTPDTRRAFTSVAPLVAPGGDLLTWIYPLPGEDPFWAGLYRQRDRHFLGVAHRLPPRVTMAWCSAYVALFFPLIVRFLKEQYRYNVKIFPASIYPARPSRWQLFRSSVFLSFDNVMPTHQFRHGRDEVGAWYRECGFGEVDSTYPGFFCAQRAPVRV
jgi:SAM-dependent methyltransferase